MVKPSVPARSWDVLIVTGADSARDIALALHTELAHLDLRVRLDIAESSIESPLPESSKCDAAEARCCVVIAQVSNTMAYALLPAPRFPGQAVDLTLLFSKGNYGQVEVGVLTEDVTEFAAKIEAKLRG